MIENAIGQRFRPRIGFLGVGWIGRNRMEALVREGGITAAGIADPAPENRAGAARIAPESHVGGSLDDLLDLDLDGIVIATPSALHAEQAIRALEHGIAVFCQKPLGRNAAEVRAVVDAARNADRLIGIDMSYRHTAAMTAIRELVHSGTLGVVHAIDLVFHNAYGPDKAWFYDPALAGGGCVIDLGVHLVDLALWTLDFPEVTAVCSTLFANGRRLRDRRTQVEDHALATLALDGGAVVRLACSWRLHAGCDAVISADFFGTEAGARFRNVNGSFVDFTADLCHGTRCERLTSPPDDWGGRAALAWAKQLRCDPRYDRKVERSIDVAGVLDRIYA